MLLILTRHKSGQSLLIPGSCNDPPRRDSVDNNIRQITGARHAKKRESKLIVTKLIGLLLIGILIYYIWSLLAISKKKTPRPE